MLHNLPAVMYKYLKINDKRVTMYRENRHSGSRRFAELLDSRFKIPGTEIRFGIDPLLGLMPGAGDWIGGFISLYFVFQAVRYNSNSATLVRMFINIVLDIVIGSIPLLGDLFDVAWKANLRNARLLDRLQQDPTRTESKSRWFNWVVFGIIAILVVGLLVLLSWIIVELLSWLVG